jgi:hypothetical protein
MIRRASSRSVGTNRSAITEIIASSWMGTPSLANGFPSFSTPSPRSTGEVVAVRSVAAETMSPIRHAKIAPSPSPSHVSAGSHAKTAMPSVKNPCMMRTMTRSHRSEPRFLRRSPAGRLEDATSRPSVIERKTYATGLSVRSTVTSSASTPTIFTRGSSA